MEVPLVLLGVLAALYVVAAARQRAWSPWRTASWLIGSMVLAWGLLPEYLPFSPGDLRQHMLQHLLLGMFAPIGLVMAAPITLLVRTLPAEGGRAITTILKSPLARVWANPITALALNLGGMAALYFTPLYRIMMVDPTVHYLVHFHFVAAGCLYAWVIAGPDPAPHRLSVPARLVILGIAVILHSVMAQMVYAGFYVPILAQPHQLRGAAELMYYGGDIAEMILAFAMVTSWRTSRNRHKSFYGRTNFQPSTGMRS